MVYWLQSIMVKEGKRLQALEWAAKIAAYYDEKYPERNTGEVLRNINGSLLQLHFLTRFESLAEYEETFAEWVADPVVQDLNADNAQVLDQSSIVNNFFSTVP